MPKAALFSPIPAPLRNACLAAGVAALCSGPAFGQRLLVTDSGPYAPVDAPGGTCGVWTYEVATGSLLITQMKYWALGFLQASALMDGTKPPTETEAEREISAVCAGIPHAAFQGVVQQIANHPPRAWLRG